MPTTGTKYRTIGLPKELYDEIEDMTAHKKYGYITASEFARDAIRRRIETLRNLEKKRIIQ